MPFTTLPTSAYSTLDATKLTGNLPAISGASLTGIAGIDGVQIWNMTRAFQGQGSPNYGNLVTNWSSSAPTNGIGTPLVGTAPVTESSGIFSFTSTGFYLIKFTCSWADNSGADKDIFANIKATKNNSTYNLAARAGQALTEASSYRSATATTLLDITDLTNQKVMFGAGSVETSTYVYGHGTYQHTYALFWRLGDT